jgi:hypothetical protein
MHSYDHKIHYNAWVSFWPLRFIAVNLIARSFVNKNKFFFKKNNPLLLYQYQRISLYH